MGPYQRPQEEKGPGTGYPRQHRGVYGGWDSIAALTRGWLVLDFVEVGQPATIER